MVIFIKFLYKSISQDSWDNSFTELRNVRKLGLGVGLPVIHSAQALDPKGCPSGSGPKEPGCLKLTDF